MWRSDIKERNSDTPLSSLCLTLTHSHTPSCLSPVRPKANTWESVSLSAYNYLSQIRMGINTHTHTDRGHRQRHTPSPVSYQMVTCTHDQHTDSATSTLSYLSRGDASDTLFHFRENATNSSQLSQQKLKYLNSLLA